MRTGSLRAVLPALVLAVGLLASLGLNARFKDPRPAEGDSPAYLIAAHNLAHRGFFSERPDASAPGVGREPAYAAFLAALMRAPTGLAAFEPSCLADRARCPPATYRAATWANLAFALAAALALGLAALRLTGSPWAGVLAALYLALNSSALSGRHYVLSDHLALLLVALAAAALGLTFGALCLTKAVFVWFLGVAAVGGLAAGVALGRWPRRALWAVLAVALLPVLAWTARNGLVSGHYSLTDARGGIALSTREVFNHMGPKEIACAFVYWTRGFGDGLARALFAPEVWQPFQLDWPGGYYDVGQHRYVPWVERVAREQGVSVPAATAMVDRALTGMFLERPMGWLASYPALFWRGIWADLFVVVGLPALVAAAVASWRLRDAALGLALAPGAFNLLFYPAISLNIPRYQITAVPALALATAWVAWRWARRRSSPPWAWLAGGHGRPEPAAPTAGSV